MKLKFLLIILCALSVSAFADDPAPYIGEWSNGRGETLSIKTKTIQFAHDKPVAYRDVTRDSDDDAYELRITAPGEINAFAGKTLILKLDEDEMQMTGYASHDAYVH